MRVYIIESTLIYEGIRCLGALDILLRYLKVWKRNDPKIFMYIAFYSIKQPLRRRPRC